jgi:uncharacterized membrane protein
VAFAAGLIGLGILSLVYGNASEIWQPIPKTLEGRLFVIYLCGAIGIATGLGLLRSSATLACRVLLPFLLLWLILLKLPPVLHAPQVAVNWESFAETAVLAAGAWCLFAVHAGAWEKRHIGFATGKGGVAAGRLLMVAALPMIGVSHFVYHDMTASLVPKWLGFPLGWTYLTGAASIAAAAGMLLAIFPRLASSLEAAMLWIFTLLVWVPRIASGRPDQGTWSELLISWTIASGAWLVADTYRGIPWLASGRAARAASIG